MLFNLIKLHNINKITDLFLKHISDIIYTLNIYDIVIQYKEKFLKHISDITYTLKIYDIILQHKEKFL